MIGAPLLAACPAAKASPPGPFGVSVPHLASDTVKFTAPCQSSGSTVSCSASATLTINGAVVPVSQVGNVAIGQSFQWVVVTSCPATKAISVSVSMKGLNTAGDSSAAIVGTGTGTCADIAPNAPSVFQVIITSKAGGG